MENDNTLRNVRQPATATGLEHLGRMETLLRRMAERDLSCRHSSEVKDYREAREIVALLPPKTDEQWAAELFDRLPKEFDFINDYGLPCIAKGRELALAERGE